ncbi:regulatory factor X-associated protein [Sarcophilus harrisii]
MTKTPRICIPRIRLSQTPCCRTCAVAQAFLLHAVPRKVSPLCPARLSNARLSDPRIPLPKAAQAQGEKLLCARLQALPGAAGADVGSVQAVAGRGPGCPLPTVALGTEAQQGRESAGTGGAAAPLAAAAPAPQLTLLVMQPCGSREEAAGVGAAAGAILRPSPAPAASVTPTPTVTPVPGGGSAAENPVPLYEVAGDAEDEAAEDEADLLDTSDPPGGGESTASPEELEDEEIPSGGEGGRASAGIAGGGGGGGCVSKTCTYEGCRETTSQVAKQRKPWMCKKHRNKMYKDKYKKKKNDQALSLAGTGAAVGAGGGTGSVKLEESTDGSSSTGKQRTGSVGDRPARPTLLEQVLNQKRLALLRSPEVVQFLQTQQQLLNQQVLEQRQQQQFPGASV